MEKLVEKLRNEASEKIRLQRKAKQLSIAFKALIVLYVVFVLTAAIVLPHSPRIIHSIYEGFTIACASAFVIFFVGLVILPFGKSSTEQIDEALKDIIKQKIERKTGRLTQLRDEIPKIEEELEVLKTI